MRYLLGLLCVVGMAVSGLRAAEKPDPRESLDTAIPEAIRLLEKKDYEGLLKAFIPPKELDKLEADMLPGFIKWFGENKSEALLKALSAVKGTTPTLSEDKTEATFKYKELIDGRNDIQFKKIDKYWYIKQ